MRSGEERSEEDAHNALVQAQEMRQRPILHAAGPPSHGLPKSLDAPDNLDLLPLCCAQPPRPSQLRELVH